MIRNATRVALACAAACLAMPSFAQAPSFPTKPVRIVVASAGSPQDVVARIVGQKLAEIWKQGVVVENKAGAGSLLSIQTVTKAPPDGYTILVASSAYAITPPFYPEAGFDAEKDDSGGHACGEPEHHRGIADSQCARSAGRDRACQ